MTAKPRTRNNEQWVRQQQWLWYGQ